MAHARADGENGADIIDIGAASSNPDAQSVAPDVEIARLALGLARAAGKRARRFPSTSFSPEVQRWALAQGVDYLNDIHGFADPALYPRLAAAKAS